MEYIHGNESRETMRRFMEDKGYIVYAEVTNPQGLANDYIFAKKELLLKSNEISNKS